MQMTFIVSFHFASLVYLNLLAKYKTFTLDKGKNITKTENERHGIILITIRPDLY